MDYKRLHKLVRGFSHYRRIKLLEVINKFQDCSLCEIAFRARIPIQNAEEHVYRLQNAGLLTKKRIGNMVSHRLTRSGSCVLGFLRNWKF